ncbi:MAG: L-seryl-tRNA(Sec) selenium transferase [Phycisphaerales bacterium]|nr:MAG: L-seryl-tRNA(Sec) selenium transferase [Phycisphaerales bacterium]
MTPEQQAKLRDLPSITELLEAAQARDWSGAFSPARLTHALRLAVARARRDIVSGNLETPVTVAALVDAAHVALEAAACLGLRPVVNATGIVLHTGLGRAPLADAAVDALVQVADGYANVELELDSGQRGKRTDRVAELLVELTGAEAATVVNNNAAATLLVLNELAQGKSAIISRGQLIEIGGSYRMPDVMDKSGALMHEVGTTNRTRLSDYEAVIDESAALLVLVHTSNYKVVGFTHSVPLADLVELGHRRGIRVYHDLGSGALVDLSPWGLHDEPYAAESIRIGADVVTFSGDKLLGGPQCGLIVGRAEIISRLQTNALARTFRVDKLTLAALEATLRLHLDPGKAISSVPVLRMLTESPEAVAARAASLQNGLAALLPGEHFEIVKDVTFAGGGSLPTVQVPTTTVRWRPTTMPAHQTAERLRQVSPPVIVRLQDDAIAFDLRTLTEGDVPVVMRAVTQVLGPSKDPP